MAVADVQADVATAFARRVALLRRLWEQVRAIQRETPPRRFLEALRTSSRYVALAQHCDGIPEHLLLRTTDESAGTARTPLVLALEHAALEMRLYEAFGALSIDDLEVIYKRAEHADRVASDAKPVRLCAYRPASARRWMFDSTSVASTSERTRAGDIQVFAITSTRRPADTSDAVHSIWRATTDARFSTVGRQAVAVAQFERRILLSHAVPRSSLIADRVVRVWPQHHRGLLFDSAAEAAHLAQALARHNPDQREHIWRELVG